MRVPTFGDRTLAALVSDYRADLPAHGLPMSLVSDLKSQVSCDAISFEGFDRRAELEKELQTTKGLEEWMAVRSRRASADRSIFRMRGPTRTGT